MTGGGGSDRDEATQPPALTRRSLLARVGGAGLVAAVGAAGCTAIDPGPIDVLPADRVVFGVSPAPGYAPPIIWALQAPSILVYASGLVVRTDVAEGERDVPSRYLEARVDPLLVAGFAADAERGRALAGDFGDPQVTDLGRTRVWVHGSQGEQEVSVYALDERFDEYTSWPGRRRRRRLRSLIAEAHALVGDNGTPYVPPRVVVLEQRVDPDEGTADVRWPGPEPAEFLHRPGPPDRRSIACGELTGRSAATVYAAALENPGQRWLVGGATRVLVVNPLPVEIDC
jgi:hypothetical protein